MIGGAAALELGLRRRQPLAGDAGGGTSFAARRLGLLGAQILRGRHVVRRGIAGRARKLVQFLLDAIHLLGQRRELGG